MRYAVAVARTGSFSAAARDYGVSQPALSNGIARLEETLGERLFDRSPRGVAPTAFGQRMLPLIERAVSDLDAIAGEARAAASETARTIRLGVSPLIDRAIVSAAIAAVRELPGERELLLREGNMDELREDLVAGALDAIVIPAAAPMPHYRHARVGVEELVVVSSTADTEPLEVAAVGGTPLILLPDSCGLTRFTETLLQAQELPVARYPGEASSYRVLEDWARLGLGTAILPASKLAERSAPHRPLLVDGRPASITYEAVWSADSEHDGTIADVVAQLARRP
nr:LysR family transcriptional regulator [Conexibacter arvalis]